MDELDDLMKVEEESLDDNVHEVREAFKKKQPNIWKFPAGGPFPYVFTIV